MLAGTWHVQHQQPQSSCHGATTVNQQQHICSTCHITCYDGAGKPWPVTRLLNTTCRGHNIRDDESCGLSGMEICALQTAAVTVGREAGSVNMACPVQRW